MKAGIRSHSTHIPLMNEQCPSLTQVKSLHFRLQAVHAEYTAPTKLAHPLTANTPLHPQSLHPQLPLAPTVHVSTLAPPTNMSSTSPSLHHYRLLRPTLLLFP